jgi:phosphatidate cytidylyltransferase
MSATELATLRLCGALFAGGAVWIVLAQAFGRLRGRRVWTTYFTELAVLGAILIPAALGEAWLAGVLLVIGVACTRELLSALAPGAGPARVDGMLAIGGGAMALLATARFGLGGGHLALAVIAALVLGRAALGAPPPGGSAADRAGRTLLALVYPGLGLAHLLALGALPGGFGYVVFCYGLTEINDSAAFLVGSSLGRTRPWPVLSPNKTVEGCLGGLAVTLAVAPAMRFAVPGLGPVALLGGAVLLGLGGLIGDLVASRFKRDAGLKDYGALVPTHGGVLDVYDSLIFVAPLFRGYLALCQSLR